jgi:hypothetical protein
MRIVNVKLIVIAGLATGLLALIPRMAGAQTMTFDEFADSEQILGGYDGGAGSAGSSGPNFGVTFSPSAYAENSADGNFANNPSPPNALAFSPYIGPGATTTNTMTVAGGTTSGYISFYYASESCYAASGYSATCSGTNSSDAIVEILGAGNTVLASRNLVDNFDTSDDELDVFSPVTIDFSGTAYEVEFLNVADAFGTSTTYFDNLSIPEPASLSLFVMALGGLAILRRRRTAV